MKSPVPVIPVAMTHPVNCQFQVQSSPPESSTDEAAIPQLLALYQRPKMEKRLGWGSAATYKLLCWSITPADVKKGSWCVISPEFQYQDVTWSCKGFPMHRLNYMNVSCSSWKIRFLVPTFTLNNPIFHFLKFEPLIM